MKTVILSFLSLDIRIHVAILLALCMIVIWIFFGKIIIHTASLFPYLLRGIFKGIYLLIEAPVCWLHEKTGSLFHNIDNGLADKGHKIDDFFARWYTDWHHPKDYHIRFAVVIYFALFIWICFPYRPDDLNVKSFSGRRIYLLVENQIVHWQEVESLKAEQAQEAAAYNESTAAAEEETAVNITMKVITKKSPLSIRDIPSVENCEILERVERENTVLWKGEIAFGNGDDGDLEPWIKVETSDGVTGWARLIYLCPTNEEDFELELRVK